MNWITLTLISTVFYGLWGFFSKLAADRIDYRSLFIYDCLIFFIGGLIAWAWNDFKVATHWAGLGYSLLYGLSGMIATLLFIVAVSQGKASVVTAITAVYPVITIVLAYFYLNETLTLRQWSGVVLAIIGVVLISF